MSLILLTAWISWSVWLASTGSWIRKPLSEWTSVCVPIFRMQPILWTPPPSLPVLIGSEWTNRRTRHITHTSNSSVCCQVMPLDGSRIMHSRCEGIHSVSSCVDTNPERLLSCKESRRAKDALSVNRSYILNLKHFFKSVSVIQISMLVRPVQEHWPRISHLLHSS